MATVSSSGGSSSAPLSNARPVVTIVPVVRQVGLVELEFTLFDQEADVASLQVDYALSGTSFQSASLLVEAVDLAASVSGTAHTVTWNAVLDLGGTQAVEGVRFRLTPRDASGVGLAAVSEAVTIGNDVPVVTLSLQATTPSALIVVEGYAQDSTADAVSLQIAVESGGQSVTNSATIAIGQLVGLASTAAGPGQALSFAWNSLADMPNLTTAVALVVTASDAFGVADPVRLSFTLANNDRPVLYVASPGRTIGDVQLPTTLFDTVVDSTGTQSSGDLVSIVVSGTATALDGSGQVSLTTLTPSAQLLNLSSTPQGVGHRLVWATETDSELAQLAPATHAISVALTLTPVDAGGAGTPFAVDPFVIGNDAPVVSQLRLLDVNGNSASEGSRSTTVRFYMADSTADAANVTLQWTSASSPTPQNLTLASGSLTSLTTTATLPGAAHSVVWDSLADLGLATVTVELSASATDIVAGASLTSPVVTTSVTMIADEPPVLSNLRFLNAAGNTTTTASQIVTVAFNLSDRESDPAAVDLTFTTSSQPTSAVMTLAVGNAEGLATAPVSSGGIDHTLGWNTIADIGAAIRAVTITAVPSNNATGYGTVTGVAKQASATIVNNDNPLVLLSFPQAGTEFDLRSPSGAVTVEYVAFDPQSQALSAAFEVDPGTGTFHTVATLTGIATSPTGEVGRYEYDPRADNHLSNTVDYANVRVRLRGIVDSAGEPSLVDPVISDAFYMNLNDEPAILAIGMVTSTSALATVGIAEGAVILRYQITDAEADLCDVLFDYSVDNGSSWALGATATAVQAMTATQTAEILHLLVDTGVSGFGLALTTSAQILTRWTATDQIQLSGSDQSRLGKGSASSLVLRLDNTQPKPEVHLTNMSGAQSGLVDVSFTVKDAFDYPVDVTVSYSVDGVNYFSPTLATYSAGLNNLRTSARGRAHSIVWSSVQDLYTQHIEDDAATTSVFEGVTFRFQATNKPWASAGVSARTSTQARLEFELDNALEASLAIGQEALTIGGLDNRALATPLGVELSNDGHVWICDQGTHRVLQFNSLPRVSFQGADVVLGQSDFSSANLDYDQASRTGMQLAYSAAFDEASGRLYVSDANRRVLIWSSIPTSNGQPADEILLVDSTVPQTSLSLFGLAVYGDYLYMVDTYNHRVLRYDMSSYPTLPTAPDLVLGQSNVNTTASGNTLAQLNLPIDVEVTATGGLVVADQSNQRLLVWSSAPTVSGQSASFAVGLGSPPTAVHDAGADGVFVSRHSNATVAHFSAPLSGSSVADFVLGGSGAASASTMSWPTGVGGNGSGLVVADRDFARALIFSPIPLATTPAAVVVGQSDFSGDNENHAGVSPHSFHKPSGIAITNTDKGDKCFVADRSNHRVLVWLSVPESFNRGADFALGQADLISNVRPSSPYDKIEMLAPEGISATADVLFVTDFSTQRLLIWDGLPGSSGEPADFAINNLQAIDVAYDVPSKTLAVCEARSNRVWVWTGFDVAALTGDIATPTAAIPGATLNILGQPNVVETEIDNPALTEPAMLNAPTAVWFADGVLCVNDAGNARILVWQLPLASQYGAEAAAVIDRQTFSTDARYGASSVPSSWQDHLSYSSGGAYGGGWLGVIDYARHRVLIWPWSGLPISSTNYPAKIIFGQKRFDSSEFSNSGADARTLRTHFSGDGQVGSGLGGTPLSSLEIHRSAQGKLFLWVVDSLNNRVLKIPLPEAP